MADEYVPSRETLEGVLHLFTHREEFTAEFLEYARQCLRNPGYQDDRLCEWRDRTISPSKKEWCRHPYWDQTVQLLQGVRGRCECCGATDNVERFEAHHMSYDGFGAEVAFLHLLRLLCPNCYRLVSEAQRNCALLDAQISHLRYWGVPPEEVAKWTAQRDWFAQTYHVCEIPLSMREWVRGLNLEEGAPPPKEPADGGSAARTATAPGETAAEANA